MPNTLAYLALIIWPFVSLLFYKRMPIVNATFWTIMGGYLILPVKVTIDFPLIPPLNKVSIATLSALIGCVFIKKVKINLLPRKGIEKWLILALLIVPFFTTLNNQEVYMSIPGLTLHDTISATINLYLYILPFIIGLQLIKTYDDQLILFKLIVVAGLIYSIPSLYEARMSPQLHSSIYGFFPHSFAQQYRFGGFRPVVFLGHGLLVAMFFAVTLGVAMTLVKNKSRGYRVSPFVIIYLVIVLYLCKTVGAFIFGMVLVLSIFLLPAALLKKVSWAIILIVIMYPLLVIFELFPHQTLLQLATDFDAEKGQSLGFRFHQEGLLIHHAADKFFFGWGGWGRNRLFGSTTDGYWIIVFGIYGMIGFLSLFGLPVISIWKSSKASSLLKDEKEKYLLHAHALIVAIIMVDQLVNASLSPLAIFFIASLLGRANYIKENKGKKENNITNTSESNKKIERSYVG